MTPQPPVIGGPPSDDLRRDHIWFLRQNIRSIGPAKEDVDAPGIQSPDDVQPLERRSFFEAIISGNPTQLDAFVASDEWQVQRTKDVQTRMKIMVISRDPNLSARCDQLLPIWRKSQWSSAGILALAQIFATGDVGRKKLEPIFLEPQPSDLRGILQGWGGDRLAALAPSLVRFLQNQHEWWKGKTMADKSLAALTGSAAGPQGDDPRGVSFDNMYCVIEALGNSTDVEAPHGRGGDPRSMERRAISNSEQFGQGLRRDPGHAPLTGREQRLFAGQIVPGVDAKADAAGEISTRSSLCKPTKSGSERDDLYR